MFHWYLLILVPLSLLILPRVLTQTFSEFLVYRKNKEVEEKLFGLSVACAIISIILGSVIFVFWGSFIEPHFIKPDSFLEKETLFIISYYGSLIFLVFIRFSLLAKKSQLVKGFLNFKLFHLFTKFSEKSTWINKINILSIFFKAIDKTINSLNEEYKNYGGWRLQRNRVFNLLFSFIFLGVMGSLVVLSFQEKLSEVFKVNYPLGITIGFIIVLIFSVSLNEWFLEGLGVEEGLSISPRPIKKR